MRLSALLLATAVALCSPSQAAPPGPPSHSSPEPYRTGEDLRSALKTHFATAKTLALRMADNLEAGDLEGGKLFKLGVHRDDDAPLSDVNAGGAESSNLVDVLLALHENLETARSFTRGALPVGSKEPNMPSPALFLRKSQVGQWLKALVEWAFGDVDEALDKDNLDLSPATYWNWAGRVGKAHMYLVQLAGLTTEERDDKYHTSRLRGFLRDLEGKTDLLDHEVDHLIQASKLRTVSDHTELPDGGQYNDYDVEVTEITTKLVEGGKRAAIQ